MRYFPSGGRWRFLLLLALWGVSVVRAQSPKDTAFLATLGELREASYADKGSIIERLGQSGHSSVRAALTAMLDDRLYFRISDQKVFIVKAAGVDPFDLIDPITLKSAGT